MYKIDSTPCCEVTASGGIVGTDLIVFAFPSMFFTGHQFHVIYLGFPPPLIYVIRWCVPFWKIVFSILS